MRRIDELVEAAARDKGRLASPALTPAIRKSVERTVRLLGREAARLRAQADELVATTPALRADRELLETIPGVGQRTAEVLVAEIGTDLSRFPNAEHLASWAGMCPGNAESGGKRHSGRIGKGNTYRRRVMIEAAWAAARITRSRTFFTTLFFRISRRAGMKKAAVAVAHRLLQVVYLMLRDGTPYREQGADYFDRLHPERTRDRLKARLESLGFEVALTPKTPA